MKRQPKKFVPEPYPYHHELELTIETLTNLGVGIARDDGWVVMVAFALPGDRVRARIFRNHKNYSEADLVEILEPAPDRVRPLCPLFGECGGCQYQHLSYTMQKEWKRQQVRELLRRIGGIDVPVRETIGSPREYGYRSKLTPHYQKPRGGETDPQQFPIGFLKAGRRNQIVDVPHCPIAMDGINKALPQARQAVRNNAGRLKKGGTLLLRETREGVTTDNNAIVSEEVGGRLFRFYAGDFFQNNPYILPLLVDYVLGQASGAGDCRYLVDAYCGVGVFALCGAERFERVLGVEVNDKAVDWARGNARLNEIESAAFLVGKAEAIFADIPFPGDETAVIIDPPRAGCDAAFLEQLCAFAPRRVVYVSCGPDTQARDLQHLAQGGYAVEAVQPFDLFPQTRHIENVVTLVHAD